MKGWLIVTLAFILYIIFVHDDNDENNSGYYG